MLLTSASAIFRGLVLIFFAETIAAFAAKLPGLKYYELLNFNPLGHSKYAALDAENAFVSARPLPEDKLNALADAARAACSAVRVG